MKQTNLIDDLVNALHPVARAPKPIYLAWGFLVVSFTTTVIALLFNFPYRPGFADDLIASPRFLFETLALVGTTLIAGLMACHLGIPGSKPRRGVATGLLVLAILFFTSMTAGVLGSPSLPISMLGMRPHCLEEVVAFTTIWFVIFLLILKTMAPTRPGATAILGGIAAAGPSIALMQIACMAPPDHILKAHVLPAAVVIAIGAIAGHRFLKW